MRLHGIEIHQAEFSGPGGWFPTEKTEQEETKVSSTDEANKSISTDELVERAAAQGIVISSAAIRADAAKILKRSGIYSPSPDQMATAERAAVEHYLFAVKAAS
jgi:hypothetical protein